MQHQITNNIHLGQTVTPFDSVGGSSAIDRIASDFDYATQKVNKFKRLINIGEYNADLARYIPGTLKQLNNVIYPVNADRRTYNSNTDADRTDVTSAIELVNLQPSSNQNSSTEYRWGTFATLEKLTSRLKLT